MNDTVGMLWDAKLEQFSIAHRPRELRGAATGPSLGLKGDRPTPELTGAALHPTSAAPNKLRNTLPALRSNALEHDHRTASAHNTEDGSSAGS
ncbi:MAG TPA: hypothetical protein VE135_06505 [Pyrinomonadaceae bacterium]|nr:hypothetical protein [Pyrinomonadaceae bacterium]